ncbi:conserved hypothetical protein [uncultured Defluviicoccus sp.]|uniref:DUF3489 domain-containing protein n=1 Tax=metagenome TaxID=256318 RepID=A0A380TC61_9ZZZZ|nr:conserved hypothetical protein [uncultured Defluviicoccus sp.]
MTDLSKAQLNTILSALDDQPRNPNTKDAASRAIGRHAERLGLSVDDLLATTAGLLDGRLSAQAWRAEISERHEPAEALPDDAAPEPASDELRPRRQREGTKQAQMIAMLKRPEGATVEQLAEALNWARHTVRGSMAGTLKKKLGLTITTERVRCVGPNHEGARGSYTVYRLLAD